MLRTAIVTASFASLLAAQQSPTVVVRSLAPFARPALQTAEPMGSAIPNEASSATIRDASAAGKHRPITPWPVELLRERYAAAIDADQLTLALDEGTHGSPPMLLCRGVADLVKSCVADFDALAARANRPIEVSVHRLPLPDGPLPSPFADAPQVAELLKVAGEHPSVRSITTSGGALRLGDERWRTFVRDQDVEVAEGVRAQDPKTDLLFAGVRATLTVHELPGNALLLDGSWLCSNNLEVREQSTGAGQATVDLPRNNTAWISFSGRVAGDGGLLVAVREPGEGLHELLLVRARFLAPPTTLPKDLLVVPVSAWTHAPERLLPLPPYFGPGDDRDFWRDSAPLLAPPSPGAWLEAMGLPSGELSDDLLILHDTPEQCAKVAAALQQLVGAQLRETALHTKGGFDVAGRRTELVQPACSGVPAVAFVGIEQSLVGDFEVEISSKISAANPVIRTVRSGVSAACTPTVNGSSWHVSGMWQCSAHTPLGDRDNHGELPMQMQQLEYRQVVRPWQGPMPTGAEQALDNYLSVELVPRR